MTKPQHKNISVNEFAMRAREVLADVRDGCSYVVRDGDTPVAVISPPAATGGHGVAAETSAPYATGTAAGELPSSETALARLIGSRATRAALGVFVRDASAILHQREIARRADLGLRSAQIALSKLVASGLLSAHRDGNRLYYRAVPGMRFEELRSLLSREMGAAGIIARHLAASPLPIERAFIFGSIADGTDTVLSDIDLLVVADGVADDLVGPVAEAQRELGREIDLIFYRPEDFKRRVQEGNHFLSAILSQRRIDVIGGPDDA